MGVLVPFLVYQFTDYCLKSDYHHLCVFACCCIYIIIYLVCSCHKSLYFYWSIAGSLFCIVNLIPHSEPIFFTSNLQKVKQRIDKNLQHYMIFTSIIDKKARLFKTHVAIYINHSRRGAWLHNGRDSIGEGGTAGNPYRVCST